MLRVKAELFRDGCIQRFRVKGWGLDHEGPGGAALAEPCSTTRRSLDVGEASNITEQGPVELQEAPNVDNHNFVL